MRENRDLEISLNVSDYYYRGTAQEERHFAEDFLNCAPPWTMISMEWMTPDSLITESRGVGEKLGTVRRLDGCYELKPDFRMTRGMLVRANDAGEAKEVFPELGWGMFLAHFVAEAKYASFIKSAPRVASRAPS